jgi:hypothetical protein
MITFESGAAQRILGLGFGASQATHFADADRDAHIMLSPSRHCYFSYGRLVSPHLSLHARLGHFRTAYVFRERPTPGQSNPDEGVSAAAAVVDKHRLSKAAFDLLVMAHPVRLGAFDPTGGVSAGLAYRNAYRRERAGVSAGGAPRNRAADLNPFDFLLGLHLGATYWFQQTLGAELRFEYVRGLAPITDDDLALGGYRERTFRVSSVIRARF